MLNSTTREVSELNPASKAEERNLIAETGCRLCPYIPTKKSKSEWQRTFHACWDPNDSNLLYIFSQNGMMKILDVKNGTEKMFHLLFRRFSSSDASAEEKPVRQHWDKVSLTPGKPGEILFLMGVSNTLYMTAVPGSPSALAELTDDSSGNFAYGSPVLQIYSHASRITSVCMSPYGQICASGDENGYINFINCVPPSSVIEKEPEEWWQCPSATPSHSNPLLRAHNGPIFSMQWLPVYHKSFETNSVKHHYLATGSEDRMVRLWVVTLGHHRSVSIAPLMVLDTQSTHVLCLKAARQSKPAKTVQRALSQWSQRRSMSNMMSTFGGSVVSAADAAQADSDGAGGQDTIYLCAGTEHGSVYMWRFTPEDSANRFEVTNVAIDDGSRLLAILHSSNRPVMNIAMTFKREPPSYTNDEDTNGNGPLTAQSRPSFARKSSAASVVSSRSSASRWRATYGTQPPPHKLVVCVSDTVGVVRSYVLHKQAEERDNMSYNSGMMKGTKKRTESFRTLGSLQSFDPDSRKKFPAGTSEVGSVFGRRRGNNTIEEEQNEIEGLMLTGESQFNSPVVACLFQDRRLIVTKEEKEAMDETAREVNKQVKFSNLASGMTDLGPQLEDMKTYGAVEVEADDTTMTGSNSLVVVQAADEIRFYPVISLLTTMSARKNNSISELGAMLSCIDEQSSTGDSVDEVELKKPALHQDLFSAPATVSTVESSQRVNKSNGTATSKKDPVQVDTSDAREEWADRSAPEPNSAPPPAPSPLPTRAPLSDTPTRNAGGMSVQSPNMPSQRTPNRVSYGTTTEAKKSTTGTGVVPTPTESAVVSHTAGIKRMDISEMSSVGIDQGGSHAHTLQGVDSHTRSGGEKKTSGNVTTSLTSDTRKTTTTSTTATTAAAKRQQMTEWGRPKSAGESKSRAQSAVARRPQSAGPPRKELQPTAIPTSELTTPALNSSQKLLSKYQSALNDDSMSVGTVDTTSSYRHEAARRVTSLPRGAGTYDDLLSVDSEAIARRMPKTSKVKKQVDPAWLHSRLHDGPSPEHLNALVPSDPIVGIAMKLKSTANSNSTNTGNTKSSQQTSSSCHGLSAHMDESTLRLNYMLDIDPNDLFGELSTGLDGRGSAEEDKKNPQPLWRKAEAIDYMLGRSLLSSATL